MGRATHRGSVGQVRGSCGRAAPSTQVFGERLDGGKDLVQGQRPIGGEQGDADRRGRRDRGRHVDSVTYLEGNPLDRVRPRRILYGELSQSSLQRYRLTDVYVDASEPAAQAAQVPDEPAHVLGRLALAARLRGHQLDFVGGELVVDDRDRDEMNVRADVLSCVDDVAQQAEARRAQLAGTRASALDRPDQVRPAGDQVTDEGAQCESVDRNLGGRPADMHDAGTPRHRPEREEVEIRTRYSEGRSDAEAHERGWHDPLVEVRTVRHQEERCDCGDQLQRAIDMVAAEGAGVIAYLRGHEGRGIGLGHKLQAYALQERGHDTVDANTALGLPVDSRDYGIGAAILADLGVHRLRLITNNPRKYGGLSGYDLDLVGRVRTPVAVTAHNITYLRTKRDRMGHDLDLPAQVAQAT